MESTLLLPDALVRGDRLLTDVGVRVEAGRITALGPVAELGDGPRRILQGTLLPGVLDLQVNGAVGRGVEEATPEALDAIAAAVLEGGATAFLPTLISAPFDTLLDQVRAVARWLDAGPGAGATPLGLHVEGPFLEVPGAHPPDALVDPTPQRIDALLEAGSGHVRLVTLAPGRSGALDATARLAAAGVVVALGHAADATLVGACVDAGARLVTHLFNAMSPLHHRAPGMVGAALDERRLVCSLIPDGHHVHPAVMRLAWRALGRERMVLITDSAAPAGAPDGEYRLGAARVWSSGGVVRDARERLAGSALLARDAARGFLAAVPDADPVDLAHLMCSGPARLIGEEGRLDLGSPARFSLLGPRGHLSAVLA